MALRGGLAVTCLVAFVLAAGLVVGACSDDDGSGATGADGGPDSVSPNPTVPVNPPPPSFPDAPAPPPDLVSRSGFMGNATLVADVGEPTEGPAWRAADGALYFTVPGSASPLRRVVPGGAVGVVAVDAGSFAPVGIATSGGPTLFVTERESLATLELGDAGEPTSFTRVNGLGGTAFTDISSLLPGPTSWFVDNANPRVYRFVPPNEMSLLVEVKDAGRTTAIAAAETAGAEKTVYVGVSAHPQYGSAVLVYVVTSSGALDLQNVLSLQGIPANAIAVDKAGRVFVAWARGIDVASSSSGPVERRADGHPALPIGAIPTSLTFGGADDKTLFVTTNAGKIYAIPVQTAGQPR